MYHIIAFFSIKIILFQRKKIWLIKKNPNRFDIIILKSLKPKKKVFRSIVASPDGGKNIRGKKICRHSFHAHIHKFIRTNSEKEEKQQSKMRWMLGIINNENKKKNKITTITPSYCVVYIYWQKHHQQNPATRKPTITTNNNNNNRKHSETQ